MIQSARNNVTRILQSSAECQGGAGAQRSKGLDPALKKNAECPMWTQYNEEDLKSTHSLPVVHVGQRQDESRCNQPQRSCRSWSSLKPLNTLPRALKQCEWTSAEAPVSDASAVPEVQYQPIAQTSGCNQELDDAFEARFLAV